MEEKTRLAERRELFKNAINIEKNSRVPNISNFWTWKVVDAGHKLSDALYDYELMEKIVRRHHEMYEFDAYLDLGCRNPMRITDAMGAGFHKLDDKTDKIEVVDHGLMDENGYRQMVEMGLEQFNWSIAFKNYAPNLTKQQLVNAAKENMAFFDYWTHMTEVFLNEYQTLQMAAMSSFVAPIENFFVIYRGMQKTGTDLRRHEAELTEACNYLYENQLLPYLEMFFDFDTSAYFTDLSTVCTTQTVLNPKQFDKLYWPSLKKAIDMCVERGKTLHIYIEGEISRFYDYFQDIPKGCVALELEQDDIFEARKNLPNMCLIGGMPNHLLGTGTKEECIDYAKKLVDEVGDGYIMSQTKMGTFANDGKGENVAAVNEFIRNYR